MIDSHLPLNNWICAEIANVFGRAVRQRRCPLFPFNFHEVTSGYLIHSIHYYYLLNFLREVNDCRISSRHQAVLVRRRVQNQNATAIRIRRYGPFPDERVRVGMRAFEDQRPAASNSANLTLFVLIFFVQAFANGAFVLARKEPFARIEAIWAKGECPSRLSTLRQ